MGNTMHPWLESAFGTSEANIDDITKTAQAMLVEKIAADESYDVSNLTDEQISALANEIIEAEGLSAGAETETDERKTLPLLQLVRVTQSR